MNNTRVPCIYTGLADTPECYLYVSDTYSDTNPYIKIKLAGNQDTSTAFTIELLVKNPVAAD